MSTGKPLGGFSGSGFCITLYKIVDAKAGIIRIMSTAKGAIFVVSAPSGAGKTSLVKRIVREVPDIAVAVSHTTRPKRDGDVDGKDYHFVERAEFEELIAADAFVEHADVFGNYYGTSHAAIETCQAQGADVILEIDWQGAKQVRERLPGTVAVFVVPPSKEVLLGRLRGRGTDSEEVIARRTAEAVDEMRHLHEADYLLVNDDFEVAFTNFVAIVTAARLGIARQMQRHSDMIKELIA